MVYAVGLDDAGRSREKKLTAHYDDMSAFLTTAPNGLYKSKKGKDVHFILENGNVYPAMYVYDLEGAKSAQNTISANNLWASGTLDTTSGLSMINEEGIEGIVTPQGTITALPAHSGVVPADVTANIWKLGEVAPNLLKRFNAVSEKIEKNSFSTIDDDSLNINQLYIQMQPDSTFDVQKFNQELRAAMNTTKHNKAY